VLTEHAAGSPRQLGKNLAVQWVPQTADCFLSSSMRKRLRTYRPS